MLHSRTTLEELAAALDAAGVGVYLYEGGRGARRWLAGAAHYADCGERDRVGESSARVGGETSDDIEERLVRLGAGENGGPRFYGVVRAREDAAEAPPARDGRAGLQAHLTHLSETLASDSDVAICAFGIDGLREFNRAYGYDSGDQLSMRVGARLARNLPEGAALARISGAKFAAVLLGDDAADFRALAETLCDAVRGEPFDVGFGSLTVTISVGAAIAKPAVLASPDPFDAALAALDEARGEGDQGLYVADPEADEPTLSAGAMRAGAKAVMRALESDRVAIAYQPVVSAAHPERVVFRECLARVRDEDGRWLAAGLFLPKIERLDLVRTLDRRVLRLALDTLKAHPTERLSVNISTRTMRDRAWLRDLSAVAEERPDAVDRLIVEMTESAAVVDADQAGIFLEELRGLGVAIALDDFGAGYSSFRHIRQFRPDWVKIDGGFARGVAENPDNRLFVDTLVGIAKNFDMATVAEFVETDADAHVLRDLGVDALQGFRYGRPQLEPDWLADAEARVSAN